MHEQLKDVLVVSPHSDDAALSVYGLLADGGSRIVTVCAGSPAPGTELGDWDRLTGAREAAERAAQRRHEDSVAMQQLGVGYTALDFVDRQYRSGDLDPAVVAGELEAIADGVSLLVAPLGIGGHQDHLDVRDAAAIAGGRLSVPVAFYAELPYAARYGWPAWVSGGPSEPELHPEVKWEPRMNEAAVSPEHAVIRRLSRLEQDAKYALLQRYATQLAALNNGPLNRMRNAAVLEFELIFRR